MQLKMCKTLPTSPSTSSQAFHPAAASSACRSVKVWLSANYRQLLTAWVKELEKRKKMQENAAALHAESSALLCLIKFFCQCWQLVLFKWQVPQMLIKC